VPPNLSIALGRIHPIRRGASCPVPGKAHSFVFPGCNDGRIVADVVRLEKGHTEGLEPSVLEHLVKLIVGVKGSKIQKQLQQSEGEESEVTITTNHCSALFVLLSRVRYEVCQHGSFDFRLASVARSAT
jgi:hypothetical protein